MKVSWNPNGTVIAIFGNRTGSEDKSVPQVTFISNQGQFMRALKLGSGQTAASANNTGITWDFTGSRLSIAIDSYLYFANVYYEFKWCYALDSIVFAYGKQGEAKSIVCFWNILTQEKILK
jgi:WD repeat-containing protein 35